MAAKRSFLLRLPPELWEDIKRWADDELRSVNAQIEYLLREAVSRRKRSKDDDSRSSPRN
jgi:hypothetical protein